MRGSRWVAGAAVVLAVAACGRGDRSGLVSGPLAAPPAAAPAAPAALPQAAPLVVAQPDPVLAAPQPQPQPQPPPPSLVATATVARVAIHPERGAPADGRSFANPNEFGLPLVFLVKAVEGDWLQVMLPSRPNGGTGWIEAADANLSQSDYRVRVELGAHRVTVWKGSDVVHSESVAVGMPSAPTPVGDFYITERINTGNPSGAYGPWAFGLSAFSDVYTEFSGGPGQIGLHGTNAPGALGRSVSHGCVRMSNAGIVQLANELPVGSPISIVP